ncbi:MAG: histidine kinase [Bacteroidota bacterium]
MKNVQRYCFLVVFIFCALVGGKTQPQVEIDSLKAKLAQLETIDSVYLQIQLRIGTQFLFLHLADSADHYVEAAWKHFPPDSFPTLRSYAWNRKAIIAGERRNFSESIEYFQKAIAIGKALNNKELIQKNYSDLARTYLQMEQHGKALEYNFQSLELAEELKDLEGQSLILHNISVVYSLSDQVERSLEYKRKSRSIPGLKLPPLRNISSCMGLSSTFRHLNQLDSAMYYAEMALSLAKEMGHKPFQMRIYSSLASNALDRELYSQAMAYLVEEERLIPPRDSSMRCDYLCDKAYALFGLKRFKEAFATAQEAQQLAEQLDQLLLLNNSYFQLYNLHKDYGNYAEALAYREKLRKVEDSLSVRSQKQEFERLERSYETKKKERELSQLEMATQRQAEQLQQRNLLLWALGGVLVLIALGMGLFYRNRILNKQHQRSLLEQRLLRAQMNPYFFFHSLSTLQQFIVKGGNKKESLTYLSRFAQLMRNILESSRNEYIPLEEEMETLENYLKLQQLRYDFAFDYQIEIDQNVDQENWGIPSMLLQPMVEQAIEDRLASTDGSGKLSLELQRNNGHLQITIEDNGKVKLSPGAEHAAKSGTQLVKQRIQLLNRRTSKPLHMDIQSLTNPQGGYVGTQVVFDLPVISLL